MLDQQLNQMYSETTNNESTSQWQQMMQQGQSAHQQGNFARAEHYFNHALNLAEQLQHKSVLPRKQHDVLSMLFVASHNLSASLAAQGSAIKAVKALRDCHYRLLLICTSTSSLREDRVEALGILDNSLFSLSSQLGALGHIDEMYRVIRETECIANNTEVALWH